MHILNSYGIEHFKTQCWLFSLSLAVKHIEKKRDSNEHYTLSHKQKISLLPVKLTTIYNEWSKSAGFKSFSDMKAHVNDQSGKSRIYIELLPPTKIISDLVEAYSPDPLYNPNTDKDYFIKNYDLVCEDNTYLAEYLYYNDPEMKVESHNYDEPSILVWTSGDLSAGIHSSVYLEGETMEDIESEAKKELISSIKSYADWL